MTVTFAGDDDRERAVSSLRDHFVRGRLTVEELADVPREELGEIEGFDEEVAEELIRRAEAFLARRYEEMNEKRLALGVTDDVASFEALAPSMLITLGEKGIRTLDDLADLAGDELVEIVGAENMDEQQANEIIMAARAHWFGEDAETDTAEPAAEDGDGHQGEDAHV